MEYLFREEYLRYAIFQNESARPITITTADNTGRIWVNRAYTSLDEFRGTPYLHTELRVTCPLNIHDRSEIDPFEEFFNLFNRNNPGANYAVNVHPTPGSRVPDAAKSKRHHQCHSNVRQCRLLPNPTHRQPEAA